jgi:hypothetical protein
MPVAAARQADVGAADPQPAIALRGHQHVVEQRPVGDLDRGTLGERAPCVAHALGKGIAELLELAEVEHPRRTHGTDPVRHVDPAEPLGDELSELQLQPADLPAQLGPCAGLAEQPHVLGSPLGYQGHGVGLCSPVEQLRHKQILSGLEGRCSNP